VCVWGSPHSLGCARSGRARAGRLCYFGRAPRPTQCTLCKTPNLIHTGGGRAARQLEQRRARSASTGSDDPSDTEPYSEYSELVDDDYY